MPGKCLISYELICVPNGAINRVNGDDFVLLVCTQSKGSECW